MIKANQNNCTGCGACVNICPKNCITMKPDDEGFLIPQIDINKCIECNLCEKVCPEINLLSGNSNGKVFAAKNIDEKIRKKSSSGGFFYEIADYILNKNGIVCGVLYDDDMKVIHKCTSDLEEVLRMMGSKYVQSDTKNNYKLIKDYLNKNRLVLFTGTPCQVAGLKNFLLKPYDNLITIQLICHGVPSPLLFEKYLSYIEKKYKFEKVNIFSFRNNNEYIVSFGNNKKRISEKGNTNYYLRPFLKGYNFRECCYHCKYSKNHVADFTIGDFWGLEKYKMDFCDGKGISFIMANNKNAENILYSLKKISLLEMDYITASKHNKNLIEPTSLPSQRSCFYEGINDDSYIKKLKKYISIKSIFGNMIPKKIINYVLKVIKYE